MSQFRSTSLSQLAEVVKNDNDMWMNSYISQNLAVASHLSPSVIQEALLLQEPMLLPEMRILVIQKGWTCPSINLISHRYESHDLVFMGSNGLFQLESMSADIQGFAFSVSDELFSLALGNHIPKAFDGHLRSFHLHLQSDELEYLEQIHHLLYANVKSEAPSVQVSLSLISAFLWYIDKIHGERSNEGASSLSHEYLVFSNFIRLVGMNTPAKRNIDFYASELFMTPRYMGTLVKKASRKTAKEWIDETVVQKIKIALKHTDKQIREISEEMEFPNTSFFCKYFKKLTSMTPLEYRKQSM